MASHKKIESLLAIVMKIAHVVIALLIFALGIIATAALNRYQLNIQKEQEMTAARNTARSVGAEIFAHMESRVHSLERMAKRLQRDYANNGAFDFALWREDATEYVTDQVGHINLQIVDAQRTTLATAQEFEPELRAKLYDRFKAQNKKKIIPGPDRAAAASAVGSISLDDSRQILALAFPLFNGSEPIGFLVSFSDIGKTVTQVLEQKFDGNLGVLLEENGRQIFKTSNWLDRGTPQVLMPNLAEFGEVVWSVTAYTDGAASHQYEQQVLWVRAIGGVMSFLSALIVALLLAYRQNLLRVTESEKKLREASSLTDLILKHSPDLIFVKDQEFRLRQLNPAMLSLYGGTPLEDILGKTTIEDYKQEEADEFLKFDRIAFEEGISETEENIVFPSGEEKVLLTTKIRFEDEKGAPYILGVGRDITSLKHYERELFESKERYKLTFEGTSVGLMDWDCKTGDVYYSDLLKSILGFAEENADSTFDQFTERLHPEDRINVLDNIRDHLENRTPFRCEYRIKSDKGDYIWVHSRGQATWDEHGTPTRMVGSLDDITEKTIAQKELLRSYQELDDFAYIASHDLKEPLRGVNNHARFLEEDYKDLLGEDGKHRIERLLFLTQHMGRLIDDLLQYSRISREKAESETVDLNDVVGEIIQSYESEEVEIVVANRLPTLKCSEVQLSQIFRNLIANAIKYNESNKKRVVIDWSQQESLVAGSHTTFSVCDNGIGIDPKFYQEVFKIFKRLHNIDTYGGGTGSGLTLTKKIVEKYRGEIWIEQNSPTGTCFCFTLPNASLVVDPIVEPRGEAGGDS